MRKARVTDPHAIRKEKPAECRSTRPAPEVWARVMAMTGGDTSRVVVAAHAVYVCNNPDHAKRLRKAMAV